MSSAAAAGKLVYVVASVAVTACAIVPTMYYFNRSNVQTAESNGKREGAAEEKARQEQQRQAENDNLEKLNAEAEENRRMFKMTLALYSVGFACAASSGPVSAEHKAHIEEYIVGVSKIAMPEYMRTKMDSVALAPPDVKTAFAHAASVASTETWRFFDELVGLLFDLQYVASVGLTAFRSEWFYLRETA
ncbi:hypothetical protein ACYSUW_14935 [Pseudomonas frederiksbergensis]